VVYRIYAPTEDDQLIHIRNKQARIQLRTTNIKHHREQK